MLGVEVNELVRIEDSLEITLFYDVDMKFESFSKCRLHRLNTIEMLEELSMFRDFGLLGILATTLAFVAEAKRIKMMKWALREGFKLHVNIIKKGHFQTVFNSNQLIHLYSKHGFLHEAQQLFDEMPHRNVFTWNAIIYAYINNNDLPRARSIFDSAPMKDTVTYNSIISAYANIHGFEPQALEIFSKMLERCTRFDEFTLTTMLNLTAKMSVIEYGKQLHSYMMKTGNVFNGFVVSSLIDMYSKCGCFKDALRVFESGGEVMDLVSKNAMVAACCREGEMEMASKLFWKSSEVADAVSWNTLISGFAQNGYLKEAIDWFIQMDDNGIQRNEHTFTSVLSALSSLRSQKHGREVHAWVLKYRLDSNPYINSGVVDMYCKCDNLMYAKLVHATSEDENTFSVTSLIVGYCSQGNMNEARELFDSLEEKNAAVWTALFSGYVRVQEFETVFELLLEFQRKEKTIIDALVLINVLSVCAIQAALHPGKQIHAYILRMRIEMEEKLSSSMVDMYAKCGEVKYAEQIFRRAPIRDRVLYNAMIAGYAHNGYENMSIRLFEKLLNSDIKPDAVTFVALLSACRHAGLVELGEKYFNSMANDYGILPEIDHYSCMVDLYGRGNCLDKAMELIKKIPFKLDGVIWGSFVNACRRNGNTKLLREAEETLLRVEVNNGARYVQLANIYAAKGEWREMCRIRKKMRGGEVRKLAGCSWVYVDNRLNIFTSGDRSNSQAGAVYTMLGGLYEELETRKTLLKDSMEFLKE